MKNYYEILEVDKNASDEIIKVAYKSLVKKFHPDLKSGEEKNIAEQHIKAINEAYDVLSDPDKRYRYDQTLLKTQISIEEYNQLLNENIKLTEQINNFKNWYSSNIEHHMYYQDQNNYAQNNANQNQYSQASKFNNTSTDNNYTKNPIIISESMKTLIAVLLTFLIIFILLKIPFIYNILYEFFSSSMAIIVTIILVGYLLFFRGKKWFLPLYFIALKSLFSYFFTK